MNIWIVVGIVVVTLVLVAVLLEVVSARFAKKDHEEFEKLPSGEKWRLQQEARKNRLLW